MKTIAKTLALALLCALAGCAEAPAPDPLQDVLGGYILRGREGTFRLDRIEKIDSTTFRTEFEHRQNVFELKLREETRLYNDYVRQGKPRNAARHSDAILRTREVMQGLDSLKAGLAGRLDEVAYYDYVFSGRVDIGNWESFYDYLAYHDEQGNALNRTTRRLLFECKDDIVYSTREGKLLALRGLDDFIVIDTDDVLMICPRDEEKLKDFLSQLAMPEYEDYR